MKNIATLKNIATGMQPARPICGMISVAMPALAVVGFLVGYYVQSLEVLLYSTSGSVFIGFVCAVAGMWRQEHPKIFSTMGLLVNGVIPLLFIVFIVFALLVGMGTMSWHD